MRHQFPKTLERNLQMGGSQILHVLAFGYGFFSLLDLAGLLLTRHDP